MRRSWRLTIITRAGREPTVSSSQPSSEYARGRRWVDRRSAHRQPAPNTEKPGKFRNVIFEAGSKGSEAGHWRTDKKPSPGTRPDPPGGRGSERPVGSFPVASGAQSDGAVIGVAGLAGEGLGRRYRLFHGDAEGREYRQPREQSRTDRTRLTSRVSPAQLDAARPENGCDPDDHSARPS